MARECIKNMNYDEEKSDTTDTDSNEGNVAKALVSKKGNIFDNV